MYAELRRGSSGKWHYVLIDSGNHRVLLASENFYSKWNAKRAARKLGVPVHEKENA